MRKLVWFPLLFLVGFARAHEVRVVATINIIADMAQQVAGNQFKVESLLPSGTDPHTYEPTPKDAVTISRANLILTNGLHLEGWLDKLIASAGSKSHVAQVTSRVSPIKASDYENSFDPHAWMALPNARKYVESIDSIFSSQFPHFQEVFHQNARRYLLALDSTDALVRKLLINIPPRNRYLITSHDAFRYFSKTYGFQVASIMGTSTDADVSLRDINHLIKVVKENQVPAIFVEVAINPKVLQQLAKDLHVTIGGKLFTDSFGPPGSDADSYIGMMVFNARTIANAMTVADASMAHHSVWDNPIGLVSIVFLAFLIAFVWVVFKVYPNFKTNINWLDYQVNIENLTVMLGRKIILSNIYFELRPGRIYGLLGSNGSGKSTLVKTMVGLYKPLSGTITINGESILRFSRKIAYLPQKEEFDMDFPVTVRDVVRLGFFPELSGLGRLNQKQIQKAQKVMEQLEIQHLADRQISQLSGGQFQRTLLARAICQEAEILILDEPFVGVDHATEEAIIQILRQMAASGKLVLIIHHDLTKVKSYFDHLVLINQRIVACGPTEDVFTEENIQATFSGKVTLLQKAIQLLEPKGH